MNIYDFADRVSTSPSVRDRFLEAYIERIIDGMDDKDIVSAYSDMLFERYVKDVKDGAADGIIEQAAEFFPDMLEDEFDVDTVQAQPA